MKYKKKQKLTLKISFAALFTLILLFQLSSNVTIEIEARNEYNSGIRLASTVGIVITDANVASYSSSGTGSAGDPYIIDNLNISTTDSLAVEFISITVHFVLRDSYLKGATYGVYISAVTSGIASIVNCTVEGALSIGGPNAHYLNIYNNTLIANQGSSFRRGLNFTRNVMYLSGPASSTMIRIEEEGNIIRDNIFYGNASAITLSDPTNSTIENNVLYNTGFTIYRTDIMNISNNTFSNNIINGKPFGFFLNRTSETISGNQYGQIYLVNSIDITIEGQTIEEVNRGIQVHNSTDILIQNVDISGRSGIEIRDVFGIQIENCILNGYGNGIQIYTATDVIIQNNLLTGYYFGFDINFVDRIQINNNTILETTDVGIYFEDNWNIELTFNIISCIVETPGSQVAIEIVVSENVSVYYNIFISLEQLMAPPAEEWSCTNIMWHNDTLQVGNYYSDWNGMGTYPLTGDVGSIDLYPFIDIDGDSLTEFDEVVIYFTDPFNADSDLDGLSDGEEVNTYETDPLSIDSDSDGMDDFWEVTNGIDPNSNDADEDPDEDGLTNEEEYIHNTHPRINDTDEDGYLDGEEVEAGTDPLNSSSFPIIAGESYLGLILGLAGGFSAAAGISTYILIRRRKAKFSSKKGKK